jgi:hypothetical protein
MRMPMVNVRVVRVSVLQSFMAMGMRMRFTGRIARLMLVLVMFIMNVAVFVLNRLMDMSVFMTFGEVQPETGGH